jgi:anti-sigma regulatory factor (Ser/Thr protein kinase)
VSGDEITLTIPREQEFQHVAQLVLLGVATRLNLGYESVDDLQTALESLLAHAKEDGELHLKLRVQEGKIRARVGPFREPAVRAELEREYAGGVSLRRVLETVVDGFELGERDDGDWIELTKDVR